ncbi:MAG: phosphate ABC transporter substrate-binding protein [Caloramator sp.]|nr:phosphate ABC transporter substrate-binding protein [Caloramator sp.]
MKKVTTLLISSILVISLLFSGCSNKENNQSKENSSNNFKAEIMFNGSSTIAPIISKISTDYIEKNKTWDKIDSSFPNKNISIYVSSGGSGAGIKSVMENTADFGMVSRTVKDDEKSKIENYKEFKIGVDALTISVNSSNPILKIKDNLTTEEIKKIFSGEIKYWDEIDKSLPHKEIVVVTRDLGGGAHEVFQKSIMGDTEVRADAIQAPSMGALAAKLIENKDAIGYVSFGMLNQNKDKIKAFKVDNVEPTVDNVLNGSYKIQRPLLIIKKGELSPQEQKFMDYVLSEEGKKAVEQNGYISVK